MKLARALPRGRKAVSALSAPRSPGLVLSSRPISTTAPPAISSSSRSATLSTRQQQQQQPAVLRNHVAAGRQVQKRQYASAPESSEPLSKTPLYDLHVAHVQLALGRGLAPLYAIARLAIRRRPHGAAPLLRARATDFLQKVTPASLQTLPLHQSTLSTLLWPGTGGIVDDTIVTRLGDDLFYVVTNAACRDKDLGYLREQLSKWEKAGGKKVEHEVLDGWGLIALQGPLSEELLAEILLVPEEARLRELYFGHPSS
ncbi:hypothetical protein G7054_g14798 [Neopestalotiopsis clavispora]|nr:hypothetical protein G7054_g14798 [Neopestalotiopsis clavispora]